MSITILSSPASELQIDGGTLVNYGPSVLYYRDEAPVTATLNDGSIASGGSVVLPGSQLLISADRSAVDVIAAPATTQIGGASVYLWDEDSEQYVLSDQPARTFVGPTDPADAGFTLNAGDAWEPTEEIL